MKKILPIALLLIISLAAKAQHPYIPIPEDSAVWILQVEDYHEDEGPVPHTFFYRVGFTTGNDTIVNGITYANYFGEYVNGYLPVPFFEYEHSIYATWFRQDTLSKKVWVVTDQAFITEKIVYDFSLQMGDTITDSQNLWLGPIPLAPFKAWVDNIDSVYFPDNTWRYRWFINSDYDFLNYAQVVMIEGVGFTTGSLRRNPLSEYIQPTVYGYSLICFKNNGEWLYGQPNIWAFECDSMLDHNTLDINNISLELNMPLLYPNPISRSSTLSVNSLISKTTVEITAYNTSGQKILVTQTLPGSEINLSQFQMIPGLYFFIVTDLSRQIVHKQKILIY